MVKVDVNQKLDSTNSSSLVNNQIHSFGNGFRRTSSFSGQNYEISKIRQAAPQFLAVGVKNILLLVYGMTLGFPTVVIPAIQGGDGREPSDIVLNRDQISWFSSINLICVPLGCIFSGSFSQPIGKKRAMQVVNIPIIISWLLFHFATSIEYLYAALFLSGLSGGLMEAPVLTYVAEITQPEYRGLLSASGSTFVILGVFLQFILGSVLNWRTIAAVSTIFPVLSIIALFFVPESPTWLIRKNKLSQAIKALQWLRGWVPEYIIEDEFNELYDQLIVKNNEHHHNKGDEKFKCCSTNVALFKGRSFWCPFILILFTFFVGHFSGKTTLQTYAVQIFHTLKAPLNKYHATILLGVSELIATILCVILIRFTGKRPLVLISTVGVGVCFGGTATYAYFLNIVPGFAIDNVVTSAAMIPKENVITVDNITKLFEENDGLLEKTMINLEKLTTMLPPEFLALETTTFNFFSDYEYTNNITMKNRTEREVNYFDIIEDNYFNDTLVNQLIEEGNKNQTFNTTDFDYIEMSENITEIPTIVVSTKVKEAKSSKAKLGLHDIIIPIPKQEQNYLLWLPLILLLAGAFFAHLGIRLIPWMLIGEVYPPDIRGHATGITGGCGYLFGFMANKFFLQMLATMTMPGTFWFYSSVAFVGAIVLYFILPETEGKTLQEIENHFATNTHGTKIESISCRNKQIPDNTLPLPLGILEVPIINNNTQIEMQNTLILCNSDFNSPGITNRGFTDDNNRNSTTHL